MTESTRQESCGALERLPLPVCSSGQISLRLATIQRAARHTLFTRLNEEIRSRTDCPILGVLHAGDNREE